MPSARVRSSIILSIHSKAQPTEACNRLPQSARVPSRSSGGILGRERASRRLWVIVLTPLLSWLWRLTSLGTITGDLQYLCSNPQRLPECVPSRHASPSRPSVADFSLACSSLYP